MTRRRSAIVAIALSLGLVLGACGGDSSPTATEDDTGQGEGGGEGFTVSVSMDAIEVPEEVTGGVVKVTLESDLEEAEANLTKVASGTTEDQFKQAISQLVAGGPIPDFVEATTGILGREGGGATSTLVLPEGDYIAWSIPEPPEGEEGGDGGGEGEEPTPSTSTTTAAAAAETARSQEEAPEGEGEGEGEGGPGGGGPPPEAVRTAKFTVRPGEAADLPDADGNSITARDYSFDVKVAAGAKEVVFRNEGPDQLHHFVLFNFGKTEPSVVEENLPAFLESEEDAPPPPAFKDVNFDNLQAGDGPVLTPGLGATAATNAFESGNTYVAACFIQDRTGGPPHAIAKGMRTVFTVE